MCSSGDLWDERHRFRVNPDPGDGTTNAEAVYALRDHLITCHKAELKAQVNRFLIENRKELRRLDWNIFYLRADIEQRLRKMTTWDREQRILLEEIEEKYPNLPPEGKHD